MVRLMRRLVADGDFFFRCNCGIYTRSSIDAFSSVEEGVYFLFFLG